MQLTLDHLAVSAQTRDAARAHIEDALGLPMQTGGVHDRFGTHNHLMGLDNHLYLEAISINPASAPIPDARWFALDHFDGPPRLTNWICSVQDLPAALARWPDAGRSVSLARGDLRWDMAVPQDGRLPYSGLFPALIQWHGALHPAQMLTSSGAELTMLTVLHPQAALLGDTLGRITGPRIRFETAQTPGLLADFKTPHGARQLS